MRIDQMSRQALRDDRPSSVHGKRHFESVWIAQVFDRYSDQAVIRDCPETAAVLRQGGHMTGYPRVRYDAQLGAVYFPLLQTAATCLPTGCENGW